MMAIKRDTLPPEAFRCLDGKKITVVGGLNKWGARVSEAVRGHVEETFLVDRGNRADFDGCAKQSDIIFFACPTVFVPRYLSRPDSLFKDRTILDCATLKDSFADRLGELGEIASVCSIHPNARPEFTSQNNMMLMPVGSRSGNAKELALYLAKLWEMEPHEMSLEQHDISIILDKFLPHLLNQSAFIAFCKTLQEMGMDLSQLDKFASANFRMHSRAMARTASQSERLSSEIIGSLRGRGRGRQLIESFLEALHAFLDAENANEIEGLITDNRKRLKGTDEWLAQKKAETDAMLDALKRPPLRIILPETRRGDLSFVARSLDDRGIVASGIRRTNEGFEITFAEDIDGLQLRALESDLAAIGGSISIYPKPE